jgi:hypothetical protein
MKKIVFLLLILGFAINLFAQKTAFVKYTPTPPEIDGFIEESWDRANMEAINVPFKTEVATIGNSTWQALYDNDNFYCVVFVEDDNHWPGWEAGGNSWEYDKPEFYWDVNEVLKDGVGAGTSNSGHYQLAPGFADGSYDMPITQAQSAPGNLNPGGTWAYSLIGEGYVYEIAVPLANLTDKDGNPLKINREIGFDITIIDQDEGITTARQRMNWNNAGAIDECWNNMDDAGIIQIGQSCCEPYTAVLTNSITLSATSGSADSVKISSNESWTIISDQSWLTVTPTSGKKSATLILTAAANTGASRTAIVIVHDGFYNPSITVTQQGVLAIPSEMKEVVKISPNPVSNTFFVQGTVDRVELFNSLGILVKQTSVEGRSVSVAGLPKGVYLMKTYKEGKLKGFTRVIKD